MAARLVTSRPKTAKASFEPVCGRFAWVSRLIWSDRNDRCQLVGHSDLTVGCA